MTVFPRSVGTFLISRSEISTKDFAVSRMCRISSPGTPSSPSRCRWVNGMVISPPCVREPGARRAAAVRSSFEDDVVDVVRLLQMDLDRLAARRRHVLADVVRADRQLAVAAVDHD